MLDIVFIGYRNNAKIAFQKEPQKRIAWYVRKLDIVATYGLPSLFLIFAVSFFTAGAVLMSKKIEE